jgi:putative oxidoreductase
MTAVFLIGRLIFGGFFIMNGVDHFMRTSMMAQMAAQKGVPFPEAAIIGTGILLLFGGISILLGWQPELGVAALVIFLVGVSIPMHNFWAETGDARMMDMINFTKNMALVGATLMFVAVPRPWPASVDRATSQVTAA